MHNYKNIDSKFLKRCGLNNKGIIRKTKINKMKNYQIMYKTITKKIIENQKGDSPLSTEISAKLILEIEKKLKEKIG